jgi:hypothetical protein
MNPRAPREKNKQDAWPTRLFYSKSLRILGTHNKTAAKFLEGIRKLLILTYKSKQEHSKTNEQPIMDYIFNIRSIRE